MDDTQVGSHRWVQACLQRLVEPSLTVDGKFGPRSTAAVKEFQRRVAEFVPGTALTVDGAVGPATIAALQRATAAPAPVLHAAAVAAPAADEPEAGHEAEVEAEADADADQHEDEAAAVVAPGDTYVERRIKVRTYGTLAARSPLLVPVPSVNGRPKRLHVVAAAALARMAEAAARDLGIELKLASAWRPHRWESREQYEAVLIKKFTSPRHDTPAEAIKEGKLWLAFDSPHETGLAIDFGVGGLTPSRASAGAQKRQPLHLWLVAHAHEYGFHPYKREPWHWEFPISLEAYTSGVLGPDDPGPPEPTISFDVGDEDEDVIEDENLEEDDAPA